MDHGMMMGRVENEVSYKCIHYTLIRVYLTLCAGFVLGPGNTALIGSSSCPCTQRLAGERQGYMKQTTLCH